MSAARGVVGLVAVSVLVTVVPAGGQEPSPPAGSAEVHEHVEVAGTLLTPPTDVSGTAWLPRATPMYGVHREWRGWDVRLDGTVFAQLLYEPGERHRTGGGATRQGGSANWGMAMARRRVGAGRIGIRTMLSAEPWTVGDCGSLNYFATGEVCDGDTIHDRQQPHDLVMELAADYDGPLGGAWRWQIYAGLAGEPAFGPTSYVHRPSAAVAPVAPLSHHWLDLTHVAFGVVTVGEHTERWKLETSTFNSRASDERRTDLDLGGLDAVSARVSYLADDRLALQVSAARMRVARSTFVQPPEPAGSYVTASATYHQPRGDRGLWATTVALGATRARERLSSGVLDAVSSAALIESRLTLASGRHTFVARTELAAMPAHHLHAHEYARSILPLGKVQAAYVRHAAARQGLVPGIGVSLALNVVPAELGPRYGGRIRPGVALFVSVRPVRHAM